jgi:hypothetical protein
MLWLGGEEKSHEKITAKLYEKMQQSFLHISSSQLSHSGIYFCGGYLHSDQQASVDCPQNHSWATDTQLIQGF